MKDLVRRTIVVVAFYLVAIFVIVVAQTRY